MSSVEWKTLDLFAGVGGIRLGFEKAGFKTVFSNDLEKNCKYTHDLNFQNPKLHVEDINNINPKTLPDFDILLGGFPCQAFSIAGYREGFKDPRGNVFFRIANILKEKMPAGFMLENVKNLKSHDNGKTYKIIHDTLGALGYTIKSKILNSLEYGNIPQNRERIFIVGFLDSNLVDAFEFPKPLKLTKSFKDFLQNNVDSKYYYNNKPLYNKLKNHVTSKDSVYQWRRIYVRKNKRGVVPTLTANMGKGGHNVPIILDNKGIRKLTPRETFNLQGFPKSFKLPNISDGTLYHQAGNSVVVPVVKRIATNIMKALN